MTIIERHADYLREHAAITAEIAEAAGIRSASTVEELPDWARSWGEQAVPAIVFPWRSPSGEMVEQVRPDSPIVYDGEQHKYLWPRGAGAVLNAARPVTGEHDTVLIVEGTKQTWAAAAYAPANVAVYGVGGCRNWSSDGIPLFDLMVVEGKKVVILLDADAGSNRDVYDAGLALGQACRAEACDGDPRFVWLPGSGATGIDDVLARRPDEKRSSFLAHQIKLAAESAGRIKQDKPAAKVPALRKDAPAFSTPMTGTDDRPVLYLDGDRLDIVNEVTDLLLRRWNAERLFCHGDKLSWLKGQEMKPVDDGAFLDITAQTCRTAHRMVNSEGVQTGLRDVWVDSQTIKVVQSRADRFAELELVARSPFVRPDGTICRTNGYDQATRTMVVMDPDLAGIEVPDDPTADEIAQARKLILDEWLGDFPFPDEANRANALALVLTPFVRSMMHIVPLAVIDGLAPGVGKNLLVDCVLLMFLGERPELLGWNPLDEEMRKLITSAFMTGPEVMVFDEAHHLDGASIARALTAAYWKDRILGGNNIKGYPNRATWISMGNNVRVEGDVYRRVYRIALRPREANPEDRDTQSFRHPHLEDWTRANRADLVRAALILVRAWFAAGRPRPTAGVTFGSFEKWAEVLGGIVETAGQPDFLGNLRAWRSESNLASGYWAAHLAWLHDVFGDDEFTARQVRERLQADRDAEYPPLSADISDKVAYPKALGEAYARFRDRSFGGLRLRRPVGPDGKLREARGGRALWIVEADDTEGPIASGTPGWQPDLPKDPFASGTARKPDSPKGPVASGTARKPDNPKSPIASGSRSSSESKSPVASGSHPREGVEGPEGPPYLTRSRRESLTSAHDAGVKDLARIGARYTAPSTPSGPSEGGKPCSEAANHISNGHPDSDEPHNEAANHVSNGQSDLERLVRSDPGRELRHDLLRHGGETPALFGTSPVPDTSASDYERLRPDDYVLPATEGDLPAGWVSFDLESGDSQLVHSAGPDFVRIAGYQEGGTVHVTEGVGVLAGKLPQAERVVGHNILGFDLAPFIRHHGLDIHQMAADGRLIDTQLTEVLLNPPPDGTKPEAVPALYSLDRLAGEKFGVGKALDLKKLVKRHGGTVVAKGKVGISDFDKIPTDDADYVRYCALDVDLTTRLARTQKVTPGSDRAAYVKREHRIAAIALQISMNGVKVDQDLLHDRIRQVTARKAEMKAKLADQYGATFRTKGGGDAKALTEPDKLAVERAFNDLDIDLPRSESGRLPATGKAVMEGLIERHSDRPEVVELAQTVLTFNGARTVYQTALDCLRPDGRVHPTINMFQASGRWSVTNPGMTVFGKRGGRHVEREIFLPDEGEVIIAADLSQVDARAVAAWCQDESYLAMFGPGRDLHAYVAQQMFGDPTRRDDAKALSHGYNYGLSRNRLVAEHGEVGHLFMDTMQEQFGRLVEWKGEIRKESEENGYILDNGWGRTLRVTPERNYTQAPALVGQSAARDIMMEGLLRLPRWVLPMLRVQVHDEIVLSVPADRVDEIKAVVVDALSFPWRPFNGARGHVLTVDILADSGKHGANWGAVYEK